MNGKQKTITRIRNREHLALGLQQLVALDPKLRPIIEALPEIPLRLRAPGFEGLAEIITAQQVSKASASAIFGRTKSAIQPLDAVTFLAAGEGPLVEAGQSRAKQQTLTGLARAIVEDDFDIESLCEVSIEEAMTRLTALKGIGPWTAEVFLLFCAGHADVFPAGDIALQHAMGDIQGLDSKPDIKTTREYCESWTPLRGVAARVLYAHYALLRGKSAL